MIKNNKLLKKMNNEELIKVVGTFGTKTINRNGYIGMKTMEKICKCLKFEYYTQKYLNMRMHF